MGFRSAFFIGYNGWQYGKWLFAECVSVPRNKNLKRATMLEFTTIPSICYKVFSRERKLTFNNLIVLIINFKSSIQRELDSFYKAISRSDFKIREVTKGAFTQARAKLNPWAFLRLNEVAAKGTPERVALSVLCLCCLFKFICF
jgi:hypothetical protein